MGTNNLVTGSDCARKQEPLCWRGPAANYCSADHWIFGQHELCDVFGRLVEEQFLLFSNNDVIFPASGS
jgi:hypothetical protein